MRDARKSFTEIARECNISTAAISDRFAELEKAGIIMGSTLQLDYKSLGYNAVCDISIKVEPEQADQVVEYIQKIPNMYSVYKSQNLRNDVFVIATLRDLRELDEVKDKIKKNKFVTDLKAEVWTDIRNVPENLEMMPFIKSNSKEAFANIPLSTQITERTVDEIDIKIIDKLSKNSRESFNKIAQEVRTSLDTVARRYKKLAENGIIKPSIQIDVNKIGYHASAIFALAFASQKDTATVVKELMTIKDNILIIKTSGDYDLSTFVMIKDIDQVLRTQNEVANIPGITRIETLIGYPPIPFPLPREYISTF